MQRIFERDEIMNKINVSEIAGGNFQQQFQESFEKILENMKDLDMAYKPKRKMVITLAFEQNEARDEIVCDISFQEKLAPHTPIKTFYTAERDNYGAMNVTEYGPSSIPGQMSLNDYVTEQTIDGKVVDTDTGEIIEDR